MGVAQLPAEEWRDLLEIGKRLTSAATLDEVLHLIMEKVQTRIQADNWSLLLIDPQTGKLRFHVVRGLDPAAVAEVQLDLGEGVAGMVAQTGEPMFVPDVSKAPAFCARVDQLTGFCTRSIVCLPLKIEDKVLGVIEVVNLDDFDSFITKRVPLLQVLADYAAIAIEKARLIERLHCQTITDSLTGLYNDRFLYSYLQHELELAGSEGHPYAVVFLDLDDFKSVVDSHGHLVGSETLKLFAAFLRERLPTRYPLVRFGGDEFVILMPGRGGPTARQEMEELRKQLREHWFEPAAGTRVQLTASFGLAVFPADALDIRSLLAKADEAMYAVKRKTKDAVSG